MRRRSGQNGTVVVQNGWYRVRWRQDVRGQERRLQMSEKIAPAVFDKEGKPKPPSPNIRRKAREIVENSGANSEEIFNKLVQGGVTFEEQTVEYLVQNEQMKSFASVRGSLYKWIVPEIGKLPLSDVNNMTVKPVISTMVAAGLSPRTVNKYAEYVKLVVASLVDNNTGEPIFERKWNRKLMGLPKVRKKDQRRPSLTANVVNALISKANSEKERVLYVLLASTGLRISEALALEIKHFTNNGRTIVVKQQVERDKPVVRTELKTDAGDRQIDLHPAVAEYLQSYMTGKNGLLFATRNGTPYLHNNLGKRWLTPKLIELSADEPGMGWHAFRRFRKTWLRGKRCQEDINNYWMGHQPETMSELYSRLDEDLTTRLREAEIVGVGFDVPAPSAPRNVEELDLEIELQRQ